MKKILIVVLIWLCFNENIHAQTVEWFTVVNGTSYDYGVDSDIDAAGNVYSAGFSTGPSTINGTVVLPNGKGDSFIIKQSKDGDFLWGKTFGCDDNIYNDEVKDVQVDANGDCYILVTVKGNNFKYDGNVISGIGAVGQYGGEGLLLKIDASGNLLWWEHNNVKSFEAVTTDKDRNVYLTGSFYSTGTIGGQVLSNPTSGTTSDMFIAKFNPDGSLIWAKHVGGNVHNAFVSGYDIACAPDGGSVYITGKSSKDAFFETATLTTEMVNSVFLVKYDSSGNELWANSYDSGKYRNVYSMDVSSDGTIGIVGSYGYPATHSYTAFYNPDGEQIHNEVYESVTNSKVYGISFNSSGEYFVAGYFIDDIQLPDTLLSNEKGNCFVAKFDVTHNVQWLKFFTGTEWQSNIHQYNENSAIMSMRIDYPFTYNENENDLEPVLGDALFFKVSEEVKTAVQKNEALADLRIYPNPVKSKVNIYCKERIQSVEIMDSSGKIVSRLNCSSNQAKVDLAHLRTGLYFVKVSGTKDNYRVVKIMKE